MADCAWCGNPATTEIYVEGKPGHKRAKTAPVCEIHETIFVRQGSVSKRSHAEETAAKALKRPTWGGRR